MRSRARRGFALLAVLWVIAGLSALALGIALAGRQAVAAARNRQDLAHAEWRAKECAEQARAVIADTLARGGWAVLDRVVHAATSTRSDCAVTMRAAGARLDVNSATPEVIGTLLGQLDVPAPRRDSMVDALLDWRDVDDVVRPLGAESAWYAARGRPLPRNGPLADIRELHFVRGFESFAALDTLLDVDDARVPLGQAPAAVLAALPGIGGEAAARIMQLRARGDPIADVSALAAQLSPGARDELLARYADLAGKVVSEPDAWILTVSATRGTPAVTAVLELRLVRSGTRAAIVRHRTWIG